MKSSFSRSSGNKVLGADLLFLVKILHVQLVVSGFGFRQEHLTKVSLKVGLSRGMENGGTALHRTVHKNLKNILSEVDVTQPNPRPEADRQEDLTVSPIESSNDEPRRLSEFK